MNISPDAIKDAVQAVGSIRKAEVYFKEQGIDVSERTLRRILKKAVSSEIEEFEGPAEIDIEELLARRARVYEAKKANKEAQRVVTRRLKLDGPFAVAFPADCHLDADGSDVSLAFSHADLLSGVNTGIYGINLGDIWNNWSGRLARLWADQTTNGKEAQALVRAYLERVQWLAFQLGNHDAWSPDRSDIVQEILKNAKVPVAKHQMRLEIQTPSGRPVRIMTRHEHPRNSMWNVTHGVAQKAMLDGWANIYIGGHKHVSGYQHGWHDGFSQMWHAVQVASYKKVDDFAEEIGLPPCDLYCCPVAIINPYAQSEINFIRWEFDPFEAVERLKWERKRWMN